ncbi:hypothetical protein HIM_09705 [Hirsutella minnesotensis 3608]|uniref:Cytochrome P450 n=1 Tax=Hirsutella minnesotensis 3608 TaxID=1043627 RepID=A0A0F7ZXL1_9HYPO|nr:hypothetical protein HIM_09705 [Hirsutella minnesotensis 3608]
MDNQGLANQSQFQASSRLDFSSGFQLHVSDWLTQLAPFQHAVPAWIVRVFVGILLLLSTTYCSSTIYFQLTRRENRVKGSRKVPLVPFWIPGLFHAAGLLNPADFLTRLAKQFGFEEPLLVKAGFFNFFVFAHPEHVKAVFRNSKRITNKSTTLFALHSLLDLPKGAVEFYRADDSGMSQTPRKESKTLPEHRINFLIANNLKQNLTSRLLEGLGQRYADNVQASLDTLAIGDEWTSLPDLFAFIQKVTTVSAIEALCGTHLLPLCPGFIDDLLFFQTNVPNFLRRRPSWLMSSAHRARRRLLDGVKRWHAYALEHCDCETVTLDDPEWEPYFGSRFLRIRQQYTLKLDKMTADARASEDLGLIFTSTSNLIASIFWMVLESIRDPKLHSQMLDEISSCGRAQGHSFDMAKLKEKPLIQSTYAEVLRLYVATATSRIAEYEDINVAGYAIPKDSYLVMYSRTMALHQQAWEQAGRVLRKPLDEFDAERFLVDPGWTRPRDNYKVGPLAPSTGTSSSERRFTMDGLLGVWIPYGGGDHICPGRHLAKHQMMLTTALLLSRFEFDLDDNSTRRVKPDMKFAPFGALPPTCATPFRIRAKEAGR